MCAPGGADGVRRHDELLEFHVQVSGTHVRLHMPDSVFQVDQRRHGARCNLGRNQRARGRVCDLPLIKCFNGLHPRQWVAG